MKFNTLLQGRARRLITNLAGGEAYQSSLKLELVSLLLTSFLDDQYYRSGNAAADRLRLLVGEISEKTFVAKAALYARKETGMRSVTHLVVGELARQVKGALWTKQFFERVVHRPDDVLEILAYYLGQYGRPLPNALKKGLGQALARFDAYQLGKYRRDSATLKLVDAVNLLHPPHTEALAALVRGELATAVTWETRLTQVGQQANSVEEKALLKASAWADLVTSGKIGYFALLRNLRNILEAAPHVTDDAIRLLTNRAAIRRSLVLPFRYRTALDAIRASSVRGSQRVLQGLSDAVDHSLENVPVFPGRTLLAVDCSGSMQGRPIKIASLFAAALYKSNDAAMMLFSTDAAYTAFDKRDATLSIADRLEKDAQWGGTNFHAIFQRANEAYDRIIILSDMQAWIGHQTPTKVLADYKARTRACPSIFSFDLAGYGSLQFPESHVYCMAGFSDKAFDVMRLLEQGQSTLLRRIDAVQL